MTETTPAEGHTSGSQIPPLLREKMLSRAATFSEGSLPPKPLSRRRSSILSESSDASRFPAPRPIGNDMNVLTDSDEPSVWLSAPLAFAILPALGGLLFQNGGAYVTDALLLVLGATFLNWCVRAPWDWYHSAQQRRYIDTDDDPLDLDVIAEADEREDIGEDDATIAPDSPPVAKAPGDGPSRNREYDSKAEMDAKSMAGRQLAREEILALISCFLGPVLGAYILHNVRGQLTRPAEGLISNYNLTIFVMAAELRPVSHIIKMQQARVLHLQRIVRREPSERMGRVETQELARRLAALEARAEEPAVGRVIEPSNLRATIQQSIQPQLDALNRAVRRYEKRQVAQSMQIAELELRLKDALSLAAAAARTGQRPGFVSLAISSVVHAFADAVHMCWAVISYPWRTTAFLLSPFKRLFMEPDGRVDRRAKPKGRKRSPPYMS